MQRGAILAKIAFLVTGCIAFPLMAQEPRPTCNHGHATYIPRSELDAYTKRAIENKIVDQQVRSVDTPLF
jgi:hypothetical protein